MSFLNQHIFKHQNRSSHASSAKFSFRHRFLIKNGQKLVQEFASDEGKTRPKCLLRETNFPFNFFRFKFMQRTKDRLEAEIRAKETKNLEEQFLSPSSEAK